MRWPAVVSLVFAALVLSATAAPLIVTSTTVLAPATTPLLTLDASPRLVSWSALRTLVVAARRVSDDELILTLANTAEVRVTDILVTAASITASVEPFLMLQQAVRFEAVLSPATPVQEYAHVALSFTLEGQESAAALAYLRGVLTLMSWNLRTLPHVDPVCDANYPSLDGSCNNPVVSERGAARQVFLGAQDQQTEGGNGHGLGLRLGNLLGPNPRAVSSDVFPDQPQEADDRNTKGVSALLPGLAKFVLHDVAAFGRVDASADQPHDDPWSQEWFREHVNVPLPAGDPAGTGSINVRRAIPWQDDTLEETAPRSHTNYASAFLDLSHVYGADPWRAQALREWSGGRVRLDSAGLPPRNRLGFLDLVLAGSADAVLLGDIRGYDDALVASLHVVWLREHNMIAADLQSIWPEALDTWLFTMARRIAIAEWHQVVFREFIPTVLGTKHGLPSYTGYDADVEPGVHKLAAGVAMQFAECMMPVLQSGSVSTSRNVTSVIVEALTTRARGVQPSLIDALRDGIQRPGRDAASEGIQRSRDINALLYNQLRELYGLKKMDTFSEIAPDSPAMAMRLRDVYGSLSVLDAWPAGLAEDPVQQSLLGELFHVMLVEQFARLRDGDRFFIDNVSWPADVLERYQRLGSIIDGDIKLSDILTRVLDRPDGSEPLPRHALFTADRQPELAQIIVRADADTLLSKAERKTNFGLDAELEFARKKRVLVRFCTSTLVPYGLRLNRIERATLRLSFVPGSADLLGRWGRYVQMFPVLPSWTETEATWKCPNHAGISDCRGQWNGGIYADAGYLSYLISSSTSFLDFDVTEALRHGYSSFLLRLKDESEAGSIRVYTRDHGDSTLSPTLTVTIRPDNA